MPCPYRTTYTVTQPFGPSRLSAEPAYTWNGVYYKNFHRGVDLVASPWNADLYSITTGIVYAAGTDSDGAKYVILRGDSGNWFCYWHLSEILCKAGDKVTEDSLIGKQGYTGNVVPHGQGGSHLHLEIHQPGPWQGLLKMTPIDPAPFLKGTTMDTKTLIRVYYTLFQPGVVVTDQLLDGHAAHFDPLDEAGKADWLKGFIEAGETYLSQHTAIATYHQARIDAGHGTHEDGTAYPADQFADDRLAGGASFKSVITGDMKSYLGLIDGLEGQLAAANQTNATLRASIDQKAQELASQALEKVKDDAFKAAYRTQANQDAPAKTIEQWHETDLSASDWVRQNVANADVQTLQRQLDEATASIGKLNETIDNQKAALANLANQASTSEATLLEAKASVAMLTKQLQTEQVAAETLRTQLAAAQAKTQPITNLTLIQLLSELLNRLKGGA